MTLKSSRFLLIVKFIFYWSRMALMGCHMDKYSKAKRSPSIPAKTSKSSNIRWIEHELHAIGNNSGDALYSTRKKST